MENFLTKKRTLVTPKMSNRTKFNLFYGFNILSSAVVASLLLWQSFNPVTHESIDKLVNQWGGVESAGGQAVGFLVLIPVLIYFVLQFIAYKALGKKIDGTYMDEKVSAEDEKQYIDRLKAESRFSDGVNFGIMLLALFAIGQVDYQISITMLYFWLVFYITIKWSAQCWFYNKNA